MGILGSTSSPRACAVLATAALLPPTEREIQMRHSELEHQVDRDGFHYASAPIKVLLLADELRSLSRIRSGLEGAATEVTCISSIEEALLLLDDERFDLVIVDRHLGGWLSAQACKALVATAGATPVVGLIDEECVLDLRDGIEARLRGVYYKDQIDVHLMRRLSQLAHLPGLGTSLNGAVGAMA